MPMSHGGWAEWRRFSAAMLALIGAFNVVEGLFVVYGQEALRVDRDRVVFLGLTAWGGVTMGLGVLLVALGLWSAIVTVGVRVVAVPVVVAHALIQLGMLAAYPAWSSLMIVFDVVIIYALTVTPAGAAASAARGAVGPRRARSAGTASLTDRLGPWHEPAALPVDPVDAVPVAQGTASVIPPDRTPPERVRPGRADDREYQPRHRMPYTSTAVVVEAQVEDTVTIRATAATAAPRHTAVVAVSQPAQRARALPAATPAATMVGAVARSAAGALTGPVSGAADPSRRSGDGKPILGAISGRWPDAPPRV
jgi:hypothetical protein